jgi:hypothetical protein
MKRLWLLTFMVAPPGLGRKKVAESAGRHARQTGGHPRTRTVRRSPRTTPPAARQTNYRAHIRTGGEKPNYG